MGLNGAGAPFVTNTAQSDGADYIGVGPTFQSSTKQFDSYHGTELLSKVAQEIKMILAKQNIITPVFYIDPRSKESAISVLHTINAINNLA